MNKLLNRLVVLLAISLFSAIVVSCESEEKIPGDWGYESKHLVTGYVFPEELEVEAGAIDGALVTFSVKAKGVVVSHHLKKVWGEFSDLTEEDVVERSRLFDSMAILYKDTAYNRMVTLRENWALAYPIDSVSIISNVGYDVNHPVGSNLYDVVTMTSYSYGELVLNGYVQGDCQLEKRVSELTQDNRTLMTAKFGDMLYCTGRFSLPQTANPQDCQLTVTYFFSNGLKLSASTQVKL